MARFQAFARLSLRRRDRGEAPEPVTRSIGFNDQGNSPWSFLLQRRIGVRTGEVKTQPTFSITETVNQVRSYWR